MAFKFHTTINLFLGLIVLLFTSVTACKPKLIAEQEKLFSSGWVHTDSLCLQYNHQNPNTIVKIGLELDINDSYNYNNIFFRYYLRYPNGKDTSFVSEYILADSLGAWHTSRSWKGNYPFSTVLNPNAKLELTGSYLLCAKQYMRDDTLHGIERVSFTISEAK